MQRCVGCEQTLSLASFPVTTCRGQRLVRSRCQPCLRAYYRGVNARRAGRQNAARRLKRKMARAAVLALRELASLAHC